MKPQNPKRAATVRAVINFLLWKQKYRSETLPDGTVKVHISTRERYYLFPFAVLLMIFQNLLIIIRTSIQDFVGVEDSFCEWREKSYTLKNKVCETEPQNKKVKLTFIELYNRVD